MHASLTLCRHQCTLVENVFVQVNTNNIMFSSTYLCNAMCTGY